MLTRKDWDEMFPFPTVRTKAEIEEYDRIDSEFAEVMAKDLKSMESYTETAMSYLSSLNPFNFFYSKPTPKPHFCESLNALLDKWEKESALEEKRNEIKKTDTIEATSTTEKTPPDPIGITSAIENLPPTSLVKS